MGAIAPIGTIPRRSTRYSVQAAGIPFQEQPTDELAGDRIRDTVYPYRLPATAIAGRQLIAAISNHHACGLTTED
jgi:hypothetical protein